MNLNTYIDNKLIRKAVINDLPVIMDILSNARKFMKENGNPDQWGDNWPSEEKIIEDINEGVSYVVVNKEGSILATFAYIIGIDKTYIDIWDGQWLSDDTYGTIHRLASSNIEKDIFSYIVKRVSEDKINIRVDTHKDNKFMIATLKRNLFKYCGLISPIEGGIRVAYEKINN